MADPSHIEPETFDRLPNPNSDSDTIVIFGVEKWVSIIFAEENPNQQSNLFTHKDVQEITKISKSQLNHLVQTETIIPQDRQSGRGGRSSYSYQNLLEAILCRELRKFSLNTEKIKNITQWLREKKWHFPFDPQFIPEMEWTELIKANIKTKNPLTGSASIGHFEWHEIQSALSEKWVSEGKNANFSDIRWDLCGSKEFEVNIKDLTLEGKLPPKLDRVHSIWQYLRLYPAGVCDFYLVLGNFPQSGSKNPDEIDFQESIWIRERIELGDTVANSLSSIAVSLYWIKREVDLKIGKQN